MIRVSELKLPVTGNQKALEKEAGKGAARACGGNQGVPHFQAFSGCQKKRITSIMLMWWMWK